MRLNPCAVRLHSCPRDLLPRIIIIGSLVADVRNFKVVGGLHPQTDAFPFFHAHSAPEDAAKQHSEFSVFPQVRAQRKFLFDRGKRPSPYIPSTSGLRYRRRVRRVSLRRATCQANRSASACRRTPGYLAESDRLPAWPGGTGKTVVAGVVVSQGIDSVLCADGTTGGAPTHAGAI
jgi:hypothetical protein